MDTPTAGTGALIGDQTAAPTMADSSVIDDGVATATSFDFSGLNGANDIYVWRHATTNNDVYTLGNFGTDNTSPGQFQELTVQYNSVPRPNTITINFGSGAYQFFDNSGIPEPTHSFVNTAPNGAGLANVNTVQTWADLNNSFAGDLVTFKGDNVQNMDNTATTFATVQAGIAFGLADAAHTAVTFHVTGFGLDTFIFDHADASFALTAKDAMVNLVGTTYDASTVTGGVIHLA